MAMKVIAFLFALQMFFACVQAQPRYSYSVERIAKGVYVLKPEINENRWVTANIIVVEGEGELFVVDSGLLPSAGEEAINEIKKITNKPVKYLLNTHWHGDHWQGNEAFSKAFPGIKIIASAKCKEAILRNGMAWVKYYYPRAFKQMLQESEASENAYDSLQRSSKDFTYLQDGIKGIKKDLAEVQLLKPVFPNITFENNLVIKAGTRTIELYYLGVGNTIGDVVAWLPKDKILISGDLVVFPSPYESGAFSQDWIETSTTLQNKFKYKILIPGHGDVQKDTNYLSYLNALYKEIAKQLDSAYRTGHNKLEDLEKIVTHESVVNALNEVAIYRRYTSALDKGFVKAAMRNAWFFVRNGMMQGK